MKKVLYETSGLPDNYTDESFLSELKKNVSLVEVTMWEAFVGSCRLVQQFCAVILFVLVYVHMYNEWVEPNTVIYLSTILTICGYSYYRLVFKRDDVLGHDVRTALIYVVFGQLFSPALYTLTDTISTDTIYTMTFFMMLVHLIFFNYGISAAFVSNSLSLSSAVFASICLASRLHSAHHAFVLITVAVEFFVLFPLLLNKVNKPLEVSLLLFLLAVGFMIVISSIMTFLFLLAVIFIGGVCPYLFVRNQKYKENIYGPWDEAVVDGLVCNE